MHFAYLCIVRANVLLTFSLSPSFLYARLGQLNNMPVTTLQIPVYELLSTIRQTLADGRDIRAELIRVAMEKVDDKPSTSPIHLSQST